ncbi:MAG: Tfp pilus assembly protein FimT/FimU [Planctomycetia bacterium]
MTSSGPSSRRSEPLRSAQGFTLIELMVVCAIVGATLLLVPPSFDTFGARGKLSSAGNKLMAELTAMREQAILDGYEARLEIGRFAAGRTKEWGTRFWFTSVPAKGASGGEEQAESARERATSRAEERQWLNSQWAALPDGVAIAGVSLEAGQWEKLGEGERTFIVRFFPDGSVERGFGIRLESTELEVRQEERTVTVTMNPLTSEPSSHEGLRELPRQKDAGEFR